MNISGVRTSVWIRTIVLIIALVNQVLISTGHQILPFGEDEVVTAISTILTVVASIVAWWKNNSFTTKAQAADEVLKGE